MMPLRKTFNEPIPSPLLPDALLIRVRDDEVFADPRLKLEKVGDKKYCLHIKHSLFDPLVVHYEESCIDLDIKIEKNAWVEMIEHFSCSDQRPSSLTIELAEQARGSFYQLIETPKSASLEQQRKVRLSKDAYISNQCINLSLGSFKHGFDVELLEPRATVDFFLLDQLYGSAQSALNLTIFHRAPHTESTQLVRAIYADKSFGSFLGKVIVEKDAAKSSAKQHYKTVLLSEQAKASVMPQLEINNFDISASHGATIGELDKTALFYLQSRGLSLAAAKLMLVSALNRDIIDRILRVEVMELMKEKVDSSLKNALGAHDV